MPVYSSNGQLIHPDDPNYAVYASQNNPAPAGSSNQTSTTQTPKIKYNPDGTRSVLDEYYERYKPLDDDAYNSQQQQTKDHFAKMLQDRLDAINTMYESILSRADETARDKLGSGNVINALSGQRGSASGARTIDDITKKNDEIRQGILSEKQNKINAIYDANYKDRTEELRYQNDLRRQDLDKYLSYLKEKEKDNITKSEKMRADLIRNGISIDDIDEKTIARMAEAGGYSPDQFKALYNSELEQNRNSFLANEQKRLLDLKKTQSEIDKTNSEISTNKNKTEADLLKAGWVYVKTPKERDDLRKAGYDISELNGRTYAKPSELMTYEQKKAIDAKFKSKSTTPASNEKAAVTEMQGAISSVLGSDGFISPDDHLVLRNQWIQAGFNPSTFDSKFKAFLNPNNPNYVTNKKSSTDRQP